MLIFSNAFFSDPDEAQRVYAAWAKEAWWGGCRVTASLVARPVVDNPEAIQPIKAKRPYIRRN